ncbi:tobH protein [Rhodococcoides kroppenstedtii]|uniref:tobH protein n=1 Tax=Rhodococcoides kroppenstedtii TaxID=293050 RepID=UPI0028ECBEAB|nr:tobH protein [Rhodococcus kroppenstedtii]
MPTTVPATPVDLDDAEAVTRADRGGVLRSAALAGAQIRATAAAVSEGALSRLDGARPRAVVFVAPSGPARRAAGLLSSLVASAGVPVVIAPATPPWVGPLDVVVVAGDDAGDPVLARSVDSAVRRRADVVVTVPDEGPVADAGAGRVLALPPRVRVLDIHGFARHVATMTAVLAAVDPAFAPGDLADVADVVDAESARHHASIEVFRNPAKSLASRVAGRRVLVTGDGVAATELARHGASVLLRTAGVVAAASELADAVAVVHEFGALGGPGSDGSGSGGVSADYDPLFHDDQIDGPRPTEPVRILTVSIDPDDSSVRRRVAVLGEVDVVRVDDLSGDAAPELRPTPEFGPVGPGVIAPSGGEAATTVRHCLVLAARLEAAAAYVQLAGGR